MIIAHDYILGAKYERAIIDGHPNGRGAGFLINVSGIPSSLGTIERLASTGKAPLIRVHGVWRDNHDFGKTQKKQAIKRAKRLAPIIEKFPNIKWYYSPFLEPRNPRKRLYNSTLKACRKVLPACTKLVASSLEGTVLKHADVTEMHHNGYHNVPGKKFFSFDGLDAFEADVPAWLNRANKAEVFFLWTASYNGKRDTGDKTPRKLRKNWANQTTIKTLDRTVR